MNLPLILRILLVILGFAAFIGLIWGVLGELLGRRDLANAIIFVSALVMVVTFTIWSTREEPAA